MLIVGSSHCTTWAAWKPRPSGNWICQPTCRWPSSTRRPLLYAHLQVAQLNSEAPSLRPRPPAGGPGQSRTRASLGCDRPSSATRDPAQGQGMKRTPVPLFYAALAWSG